MIFRTTASGSTSEIWGNWDAWVYPQGGYDYWWNENYGTYGRYDISWNLNVTINVQDGIDLATTPPNTQIGTLTFQVPSNGLSYKYYPGTQSGNGGGFVDIFALCWENLPYKYFEYYSGEYTQDLNDGLSGVVNRINDEYGFDVLKNGSDTLIYAGLIMNKCSVPYPKYYNSPYSCLVEFRGSNTHTIPLYRRYFKLDGTLNLNELVILKSMKRWRNNEADLACFEGGTPHSADLNVNWKYYPYAIKSGSNWESCNRSGGFVQKKSGSSWIDVQNSYTASSTHDINRAKTYRNRVWVKSPPLGNG